MITDHAGSSPAFERPNGILNLAINARDAMAGSGRLTIAVCNAVVGVDGVPSGSDEAAASYVSVAVTDTGHGMDSR